MTNPRGTDSDPAEDPEAEEEEEEGEELEEEGQVKRPDRDRSGEKVLARTASNISPILRRGPASSSRLYAADECSLADLWYPNIMRLGTSQPNLANQLKTVALRE